MPRKHPQIARADRTAAGIAAMEGQTIEEIVHETHGGLTISLENGLVVCVYADLTNDMAVDIEERPSGNPVHGEARTAKVPSKHVTELVVDGLSNEGYEAEAGTDDDDDWGDDSEWEE